MATSNSINANNAGYATYNGSGTWAGRTMTPANSSVAITNGDGVSGNTTFAVTGGGFPWTDITGATQTLAINNGYVTNRGGGVAYTLPATATEGDMIWIAGKSGAWSVAQAAGQQILIGSSSSTAGVTGSIASTNAGDCILLLCTTGGASTIWRAVNLVGNITIA
jgi:hypothetical protein